MFNIKQEKTILTGLKKELPDITGKTKVLFGEIKYKYDVVVVGCGAVGSGVIERLSQLQQYIETIRVIDFDFVDPHNVGCQCFGYEEIGSKKVDAIGKRMLRDRNFKIDCIDKKLDNVNIAELLSPKENTIFIVSVDNIDVAKLIFQFLIGKNYFLVMYPGIPLHVGEFKMATGTVRIMYSDEDLQDILDALHDTTHENLMQEALNGIERGCRTQQYAPLVAAVCAATSQLFGSIAFATQEEDSSWLFNSLSRVYTIGGVLPYVSKHNTYS